MNYQAANELLNAVRAGAQDIEEADIVEALQATGDVDMPDYPVVRHKPKGTWELRNRGLAPALWCESVTAMGAVS